MCLSFLFHVSPSGYSASFTSLRAFVWKSSRLMGAWKSLLTSTTAMRAFDLGAICSSKSSKYLLILFLFPSLIFPSISHFPLIPYQCLQTNKWCSCIKLDHWHCWVDPWRELPPFPPSAITFHQTIVISPVQNWALINSCKVCHVHILTIWCRAMEIQLSIWKSCGISIIFPLVWFRNSFDSSDSCHSVFWCFYVMMLHNITFHRDANLMLCCWGWESC